MESKLIGFRAHEDDLALIGKIKSSLPFIKTTDLLKLALRELEKSIASGRFVVDNQNQIV